MFVQSYLHAAARLLRPTSLLTGNFEGFIGSGNQS